MRKRMTNCPDYPTSHQIPRSHHTNITVTDLVKELKEARIGIAAKNAYVLVALVVVATRQIRVLVALISFSAKGELLQTARPKAAEL